MTLVLGPPLLGGCLTEIVSGRFMPISRDLSKSKTNLIQNWLECGMKREPAGLYSLSAFDFWKILSQT